MTNIRTHDIDRSKVNLTEHSFLNRLDMISIRDHRGRFDNALVVAAFPNKYLSPTYLDITILLDGKIQRLSVNRHNIVERKKLFGAYTTEKYSTLKKLFSKPLPIAAGDFALDRSNNLLLVSELKNERGLFVISTTNPNRADSIPEKELQVVKNVRLDFVKLEDVYNAKCYRGYRRTI